MLQASGADRTLNDTVAGGVGFTAITVAWLARLNPVGMLIVSVLFCILEKGCASVQSGLQPLGATAEVLQGIILFFVLGCEFFLTHRVCRARQAGRRRGTWLTASGSTSSLAAIPAGMPLLLGTLGEILTEKAGNLNLGVEGMSTWGPSSASSAAFIQTARRRPARRLGGGLLGALIYAFLTVTLKANQNVTGLTLTIFGTGLAALIGENLLAGGSVSVAFSEELKAAFGGIAFRCLRTSPISGLCSSATTFSSLSAWSAPWPWASTSTTRAVASTCARWARTPVRRTPRASM